MFGLGTMTMQVIFGALFANLMRLKKLTEEDIRYLGSKTAGRVLYYGGMIFSLVGAFILLFPSVDNWAISTGLQVPNLNAVDVGFLLVVSVVGILGVGSMVMSTGSSWMRKRKKGRERPWSRSYSISLFPLTAITF